MSWHAPLRRAGSLGVCVIAACAGLLTAGASAEADQVAALQPWNGVGGGYCIDSQQSIATTFSPTVSGQASAVSVWLASDFVDREVSAEIHTANADGSPTSTILGTTAVTAPGDRTNGVHEDSGTFTSGPVLVAGTTYTLALTSSAPSCEVGWSSSSSGAPAWYDTPGSSSGWQEILYGQTHQAFALSVAMNTPPTKPATPTSDESLNSDGNETISWTPATDPDGDSIDHFVLQDERSDQSSFSTVANVSGTSYRFGTDGASEQEGTWTYRVIAVDSAGNTSDPSDASNPVVVDETPPNAPTASTTPTAAYTDAAGTHWYKDTVTVSFADNGDPPLVDGSPGSGVASVTPPKSFGPANVDPATGAFSITGTVSDRAANVSAPTTVSGKIDWQAPTASFANCPSSPVLLNGDGTINWTVSDRTPSSGLATPASGSLSLNTRQVGSQTVSSPVPVDNVGHTGNPASCTYTVGYAFGGFSAPVSNAPAINGGHGGRTYPLKWSLAAGGGKPVTALSAVKSITYNPSACSAFTTDPSGSVQAGATGRTGLRSSGGVYTYNWSTPGPGCYTLFLTLDSGQVLPAYFDLS